MAPVTDLQEDDDELDCLYEETGEAEASRERPRRRVWPWVLLGTGLPVAITLTTCAMTGQRVMQEPAAAVVTTPPPPPLRPAVPEASTGAAAAPAPAAGPSTPPPASTRAVVVVREASALASTNRAEAARTKAEEVEKSRAAARQGAQQQVAQREGERPGVNRAAPWVNEHPEFTIPSHTPISCTPDGPINSEAQGPITCTIDAAVRSEDGTNFLLWPGAVIEGYLSSGLQYGQRRLMVAFERIRTTDYVRIPLRGIGASQLGENGITGTYDSHLWEKIQ
ncbi:TrbI/VirB10 family protein, partial [Paracraurococcus lichenis]